MLPVRLQPMPQALRHEYRSWDVRLANAGVPECTTWRLQAAGEVRYLKVAERGWRPGLGDERERLDWAGDRLRVPRIVGSGYDRRQEWLVTSELPGRSALDRVATDEVREIVTMLATGLRDLHETPAEGCPFLFDLDRALALAAERVASGAFDPGRHLHPEFEGLAPDDALRRLKAERPGSQDRVLCHGDYCLPNVIWGGDLAVGYLDLGELGVADRWWDLAVATWSLEWNLGAGWEPLFLETYGAAADPERRTYFRLLYDLVS
jgi:kanamycin kinase